MYFMYEYYLSFSEADKYISKNFKMIRFRKFIQDTVL